MHQDIAYRDDRAHRFAPHPVHHLHLDIFRLCNAGITAANGMKCVVPEVWKQTGWTGSVNSEGSCLAGLDTERGDRRTTE